MLAGKATVALVLGAILGVLGFFTTVGLGSLALGLGGIDAQLDDPDVWWMVARGVLAMSLWGFVGVGLGVMVPARSARSCRSSRSPSSSSRWSASPAP